MFSTKEEERSPHVEKDLGDMMQDLKRFTSKLPTKLREISESVVLLEVEHIRIEKMCEVMKAEIIDTFEKLRNIVKNREKELLDNIDYVKNIIDVSDYIAQVISSMDDFNGLLNRYESLFESTDIEQVKEDCKNAKKLHECHKNINKFIKGGPKLYKYCSKDTSNISEKEWDKFSWDICADEKTLYPLSPPKNFRRTGQSTFEWDMQETSREDSTVAIVVINNENEIIYKDSLPGNATEITIPEMDLSRSYNLRLKVGYEMRWSELSNNVIVKPVLFTEEKNYGEESIIDFHWKESPYAQNDKRWYEIPVRSSYEVVNKNNYLCMVTTTVPCLRDATLDVTFRITGMKKKGRSMFIGISQDGIDQSFGNNYVMSGWYLHCFDGTLYSGQPHNYGFPGKKYFKNSDDKPPRLKEGSTVAMDFDLTLGTLSFDVDGNSPGIAYENIPLDKPLYPTVILCSKGDSIEII